MIFIIILAILILLFLMFNMYVFSVAFLRKDIDGIDDIYSKHNEYLGDKRPMLKRGTDFIHSTEHKWVYIKSLDGLKLAARYYDNKSEKTIILCHGYRSSGVRDFAYFVEFYYNMGFNVLLIDERAHGKSEGKVITYGIKEQYDVKLWTEYVNTSLGKPKSIVLSGLSMGSATVQFASGLDLPSNVKCIIADCGFTSPTEIIKKVAKQSFHINVEIVMPVIDLYCRVFGGFKLLGNSTVNSLKKTKIPILFIHGLSDNYVPYQMSKDAYEATASSKDILLVEGAGHCFSYYYDNKAFKAKVEDFLSKYE